MHQIHDVSHGMSHRSPLIWAEGYNSVRWRAFEDKSSRNEQNFESDSI